MTSQDRHQSKWRKRVFGALSLLLLACLAWHPELRLLVPFLDAIGLDVFMALLGSQAVMFLVGTLKPLALLLWRRTVPAIHFVERRFQSSALLQAPVEIFDTTLANNSGIAGQYAWVCLHAMWRAALRGPGHVDGCATV